MSADIDLWLGDARELAPKVKGPIHAIITDPPYGVKFHSKFAQSERGKKYTRFIAGDRQLPDAIALFGEVMLPLVDQLADEAELYIFTQWTVLGPWIEAVNALGKDIVVKNVLCWEKGWPGLGDLDGNWALSFELIIYAKKGRRPIRSRRSSVLAYDRLATMKHIHPSEKPVELLSQFLLQSTSEGDLVVDPFAGSGSTLAACQRMGRRAIGIEVDEQYHRDATSRLTQAHLF